MIEKLLRTFLAVPVTEEVRSKKNMLYSTLEGSPAKINWVKNTHLHLTLKFLGYTPELSNSEVIDHIETTTRDVKPFNLIIEETGCFPIPERPRVLWMGVTGDLKPLLNLVSRIERSLDGLGFPKERQDYSAHITLARVKYPQKCTPDVGLFLKSSYDPIDFTVDRVQFLSSELLPSGTIYTLLGSYPLGETL